MLMGFALVFLAGMLAGALFMKAKLPGLLGMLAAGMVLGPHALDVLDGSLLAVSAEFRQLALVIILACAGLSLDMEDLKRVGRPAVLMCFVPATLEILGMMLLAPWLMGVARLDAAIMGAVVAAVSPAVVVPRMMRLMESGYGRDKGVPQLLMAGASVDDIYVIVLFTSFVSLACGGEVPMRGLAGVPVSILAGAAVGAALGSGLAAFFKRVRMRDSAKVVVMLGVAFLLVSLEERAGPALPFSGLLAVMATGIAILRFNPGLATRLAAKFSKLWIAAELLLFVLVGATVDLRYAVAAGPLVAVLLLGVLAFRMAGVFVCLWRTPLNMGERAFCAVAYLPKATVQAAIGGIPLAMGLDCGRDVLTVAVLSILITAPLGAFGIDRLYTKCLSR